ncbi:MAG: Barstar (barnase inhibitor), partial [Lachnospiraceae bacterium]|nr:Barstar (barnase inhibitor) [Lachnospiraceae bacterium]
MAGNNFSVLEGFYDEMEKLLTKDLTWKPDRNLDAFNDLLHVGFGVHEYGEILHIIWLHFS